MGRQENVHELGTILPSGHTGSCWRFQRLGCNLHFTHAEMYLPVMGGEERPVLDRREEDPGAPQRPCIRDALHVQPRCFDVGDGQTLEGDHR